MRHLHLWLAVCCLVQLLMMPARGQEAEPTDEQIRAGLIQLLQLHKSYLEGQKRDLAVLREDKTYLYEPPGIDDYISNNLKLILSDLKKLKDGKTPVYNKREDAWLVHDDGAPATEVLTLMMASLAGYRRVEDINAQMADNCRSEKDRLIAQLCSQLAPLPLPKLSVMVSQSSADGKWSGVDKEFDPASYMKLMDRVAKARWVPLKFGHRLGRVRIDAVEQLLGENSLRAAVREAQAEVDRSKRTIDEIEKEVEEFEDDLHQTLAAEESRLRPLKLLAERAMEKIAATIAPSSPKVSDSSALIQDRNRRRIDRIDKVVAHLTEGLDNDQGGYRQRRITALRQERARLLEALEPLPKPEELEKPIPIELVEQVDESIARFRLETKISNFKIGSRREVLKTARDNLAAARKQHSSAQEQLAATRKRLAAAVNKQLRLKRLLTLDADFEFETDQDRRSTRRVEKLDDQIAKLSAKLFDSDVMYNEIQFEISRLNIELVRFARDFEELEELNIVGQGLMAAVTQILSEAYQSKSMGEFAGRLYAQIAMNVLSPQKYYTLRTKGKKAIATPIDIDAMEVVEWAGMSSVASASRSAGGSFGSALEGAGNKLGSGQGWLRARQEFQDNLKRDIRQLKAKPSKVGTGTLTSVAIDGAVELAKLGYFKNIIEPSLRVKFARMVHTSATLTKAIDIAKQVADLRQVDRQAYKEAVAQRDKLSPHKSYGALIEPGFEIRRNELFQPEAGYSFTIEQNAIPSQTRELSLSIGGIEIPAARSTIHKRFTIDAKAAKALDDADLPEELPVRITVR